MIVLGIKRIGRRLLCEEPRTPVLKEIDRVLAAHYGFTEKELDVIPSTKLRAGNYDIKYRMGRDTETEAELNSCRQNVWHLVLK